MRQSQLFLPVRREDPADEHFANAKLLVRGGYVEKLHAGVYSLLPLGLLALKRLEALIREQMHAVGGQEIFMPALHPKELWETTGRLRSYDPPLYRVSDSRGREFILAPTHEEVVVPLAKIFIRSYRDLPLALYQFQTKFRNELRAKSGLLRGREFSMKDLYSFHEDDTDLLRYYEEMKSAYQRIFSQCGIGEQTILTFASGGTFSQFSHEFQTLVDAGEDTVFICASCRIGVNNEIIESQPACPQCGAPRETMRKERAIEVGNIFPLKTKFSKPFGLTYRTKEGEAREVVMGCYGIGLGRLMAAIVETNYDAKGICWPKRAVSPFDVHVLAVGPSASVAKESQQVVDTLQNAHVSVLYDDRGDVQAGEKFETADLIGISWRIVISERTLKEKKVELKHRSRDVVQHVDLTAAVAAILQSS